ncbi:MAG: putative toxin-antitoxin system toxin component, PIN family [Burkholderiales bacterium]
MVLSALLFQSGTLTWVRRAWQTRAITPLVSPTTAQELLRVFAYPKFKLTELEQHELLADYLPYCATVKLPARLPAVLQCRDADDMKFLYLAKAGKAEVLMTGDADLLALSADFNIPILTAAQVLARWPSLGNAG